MCVCPLPFRLPPSRPSSQPLSPLPSLPPPLLARLRPSRRSTPPPTTISSALPLRPLQRYRTALRASPNLRPHPSLHHRWPPPLPTSPPCDSPKRCAFSSLPSPFPSNLSGHPPSSLPSLSPSNLAGHPPVAPCPSEIDGRRATLVPTSATRRKRLWISHPTTSRQGRLGRQNIDSIAQHSPQIPLVDG
uniref:Uncharacterized protein n=1 Tax=Oryza rufipogon TaxID=4529 RepID=A0A0E0QN59_ORYRU